MYFSNGIFNALFTICTIAITIYSIEAQEVRGGLRRRRALWSVEHPPCPGNEKVFIQMKCRQEWNEDQFIGGYGNSNSEFLGYEIHGEAFSLYDASLGRLCHGEEYQFCPSSDIFVSSHCSVTIKHGELLLDHYTVTPTPNQPCDEVYKFKIPAAPRPPTFPPSQESSLFPTWYPSHEDDYITPEPSPVPTYRIIHDDFPAHTPRQTPRPTPSGTTDDYVTPEPSPVPTYRIIHDDFPAHTPRQTPRPTPSGTTDDYVTPEPSPVPTYRIIHDDFTPEPSAVPTE